MIHTIWTIPRLTTAMMVNVAIVPVVQTGAILLVQRLRSRTLERDPVERLRRFFLYWLALLVTLGLSTLVTGLLFFRAVDVTATMVSTLLFVPVAQSGAALLSGGASRATPFRWPGIGAHPLTGPVLWIDAVMLPAGWAFANHPLVGMAVAAVIQRRWIGIKLMVASAVLLVTALRPNGLIDAKGTRVLVVAAIVLGAIGLDALVPWIFVLSEAIPGPLAWQPRALRWLEAYGGALGVFIFAMLRAIPVTLQRSAEAGAMLRRGTVGLFVAALALMMNGFLSLQPAAPWAGVAMTCGSVAATFLAVGALFFAGARDRPAA